VFQLDVTQSHERRITTLNQDISRINSKRVQELYLKKFGKDCLKVPEKKDLAEMALEVGLSLRSVYRITRKQRMKAVKRRNNWIIKAKSENMPVESIISQAGIRRSCVFEILKNKENDDASEKIYGRTQWIDDILKMIDQVSPAYAKATSNKAIRKRFEKKKHEIETSGLSTEAFEVIMDGISKNALKAHKCLDNVIETGIMHLLLLKDLKKENKSIKDIDRINGMSEQIIAAIKPVVNLCREVNEAMQEILYIPQETDPMDIIMSAERDLLKIIK
jgi:hypothetical protein